MLFYVFYYKVRLIRWQEIFEDSIKFYKFVFLCQKLIVIRCTSFHSLWYNRYIKAKERCTESLHYKYDVVEDYPYSIEVTVKSEALSEAE